MSNLIDRVGGSIDAIPGASNFSSWTEELSPGEMQIISFLRLLYHHRPPKGILNNTALVVFQGLQYKYLKWVNYIQFSSRIIANTSHMCVLTFNLYRSYL